MYTIHNTLSTFILFFLLACIISSAISEKIENFYREHMDILSFPAKLSGAARYRKRLLSVCTLLLFIPISELPLIPMCFKFIFFLFMLSVMVTDIEQHVIFDRMLIPLCILSFPMIFAMDLSLWNHVLSAIIGGGIFLILAILSRGGFGGGDIKLVFALGLWLGGDKLLSSILLGCILGGIAALFLLITGKKRPKEFFAYGPCLAAGATVVEIFEAIRFHNGF